MHTLPANFAALFTAACAARAQSYSPYSRYAVGCALLDEQGRVFAGCNVENAAYLQSCAETGAISAMIAAGGKQITACLVVAGHENDGQLCTPCGSCRQRLREFAAADTPIYACGPEGFRRAFTLAELLPHSFGPENLP